MRSLKRLGVMLAATMLAALTIGPGIALAADVQHGIGFTKGCASPTKIGDPYTVRTRSATCSTRRRTR